VRSGRRRGRRIELIGEGAQALGDYAIGAGAGFGKLSARLLLSVVNHFRGRLLGGLDDRGEALGGAAGKRAGLGWTFPRAHSAA
jgi:hypothetical protein